MAPQSLSVLLVESSVLTVLVQHVPDCVSSTLRLTMDQEFSSQTNAILGAPEGHLQRIKVLAKQPVLPGGCCGQMGVLLLFIVILP